MDFHIWKAMHSIDDMHGNSTEPRHGAGTESHAGVRTGVRHSTSIVSLPILQPSSEVRLPVRVVLRYYASRNREGSAVVCCVSTDV